MCKQILEMSEAEIKKIIFTDEKLFKLNSNCETRRWCKKGVSNIVPCKKEISCLMLWLGIGFFPDSSSSLTKYVTFPIFIEGTVTADVYQNVLSEGLIPIINNHNNNNFIFQQDNALLISFPGVVLFVHSGDPCVHD